MAKSAPDAFLDAAFAWLDDATSMVVCSAQPTTYAEAVTTFALADVVVAPTDFVVANGTTSGRKVTVAAKAGVPVDATGTATHIALVTTTGSVLRYVTTTTSQALTSGNTVDIPAWTVEIADPV